MTDNKELLYRIVEAFYKTLTAEWSDHAVKEALNRIINHAENTIPKEEQKRHLYKTKNKIKENYAISLLEKTNIPKEKKDIFIIIAKKYEKKEFFPRLSDVRSFIAESGENPTINIKNIKDRNSAFRALLNIIVNFSDRQLDMFMHSAEHMGPTKLGPISDAISSVSKTLTRQSHDDKT